MKKNLLIFGIVGIIVVIMLLTISYFTNTKLSESSNKLAYLSNNMEEHISNSNVYSVSYNYDCYNNVPINYTYAKYRYETDTPEKAIGISDYVFIARINNIARTEYRNPHQTVIDGKVVTVSRPYTVYNVTVVENIKGELIRTKEIEIVQFGGLNQDTKSYSFHEGMGLLNVGEYYILLAYTSSKDGTLNIEQADNVVPLGNLEENDIQAIKDNTLPEIAITTINKQNEIGQKPNISPIDIFARYTKAAQNPIIPDGEKVLKSNLYDAELS